MKSKIIIFIMLCMAAMYSNAQTLTPEVISTAGEQVQAGGISLSYTVGEAGGVTTQTAGGIILTQGFQQVDPPKTTASGNTPIITVTASLNTFTTSIGTPSATQNFSVSGASLQNNLSLSAPTNFEISLSQNSGFGASLSLTPSSGTVTSTTIYVRYNPSALGSHTGKISCTSTNAATQDVTVNGITPIIYVTANLNTFTTTVGTPSSAQSFSISGSYLLGNINLSAPSNFEISLSQSTGYGSSIALTPISGSVATTAIYVRYNPSASGQHNGNISCNSANATSITVAVFGATGNPSPVIITSVNILNNFTTTVGTPSSSQSFTVSGNYLTANLVVTAPSDFQVSLTSSSGFGGSVTFTPSGGSVNNGIVYVRYNPTTSGSHSGNVQCASAGATAQNVAVSGNATTPAGPVVTATNISNTFNTVVGTPSAAQAMAVSGSNLTGNITITSPTQFEVSLSSSSGFTNILNLTPSSGSVATTIIYVRYNPSAAATHSGSVNVASSGANTQSVNVNGVSTTTGIIAANENSMSLRLFPNPTNNITNLDFNLSKSGSVNISLMDIQGRSILEKTLNNLPAGINNSIIDMSNIANGIYLVKLSTSNGQSWCKLVVEK